MPKKMNKKQKEKFYDGLITGVYITLVVVFYAVVIHEVWQLNNTTVKSSTSKGDYTLGYEDGYIAGVNESFNTCTKVGGK